MKNNFSDQSSAFPNTIPSAQQFEEECQKLGINKSSKIVVFDNKGIFSSPRVWWMFKTMGHNDVAVLDGGLPEWIECNFPTEERKSIVYSKGDFQAKFNEMHVKTYQEILDSASSGMFSVIDARSAGRFNGTEPEPREWIQSGQIPGSINLPYQEVLNGNKFKNADELMTILSHARVMDKETVFSCGSGLTACILVLANEIAGGESRIVFDGSWTEWAETQGLLASN